MLEATEIITCLDLEPHPEGGFYKRFYTGQSFSLSQGVRPISSSIYYLLTKDSYSSWHQLKSDELWFFHEGCPIEVHCFDPSGGYFSQKIGLIENERMPQALIPAGTIFAASIDSRTSYPSDWALISCVVSPGFDFEDFSLISASQLLALHPEHADIIRRFSRYE